MEDLQQLESEIFSKTARLCSRSEECSPDIRKKIREWGGDEELQEKIIARLVDEKFLDDERYARAYVRDKFRFNKWGRVKMRYYLKMKGLSDTIIESGMQEIDQEEYVKLLVRTLKDKAKTIKKREKFEKMGQLIRFAQGRGFEPELIHRHLSEIVA